MTLKSRWSSTILRWNDKCRCHTFCWTECPSHPAVTSSSTTVVLYPMLLVVELLICIHIRNLRASENLPRIMNIITHIHIYKRWSLQIIAHKHCKGTCVYVCVCVFQTSHKWGLVHRNDLIFHTKRVPNIWLSITLRKCGHHYDREDSEQGHIFMLCYKSSSPSTFFEGIDIVFRMYPLCAG